MQQEESQQTILPLKDFNNNTSDDSDDSKQLSFEEKKFTAILEYEHFLGSRENYRWALITTYFLLFFVCCYNTVLVNGKYKTLDDLEKGVGCGIIGSRPSDSCSDIGMNEIAVPDFLKFVVFSFNCTANESQVQHCTRILLDN